MASPILTVRDAQPADVVLIMELIRELAEYERLAHEVTGTVALMHDALFGARPSAEALIGEVDAEPAGFALFFPNFSTFQCRPGLYLEDLYVRPTYRGLGLGKRLLLRVAAIAHSRGCGRYEWSVLDWNTPSIQFYEGLGAEMHAAWRRMRVEGAALEAMAAGSL